MVARRNRTIPPLSIAIGAALAMVIVASSAAAQPAPPRCMAHQLGARAVTSIVGAGQVDAEFAFVNHGPGACTLDGYPHVQMLTSAGDPIATDDQTAASHAEEVSQKLVTVARGKSAYFSILYENGTGFTGTCPTASWLLLIPPQVKGAIALSGAGARIQPFGGTTTHSCGEVQMTPVTMPRRASRLHQ